MCLVLPKTLAHCWISGVSKAIAPHYPSWDRVVAAWQVGCTLGGHFHEADPQLKRLTDTVTSPSLCMWCEAGESQHQHSHVMHMAVLVATESLDGSSLMAPTPPSSLLMASQDSLLKGKRGRGCPKPSTALHAASQNSEVSTATPTSSFTSSITTSASGTTTLPVRFSAAPYSSTHLPTPTMEELVGATQDMPGLRLGIARHLNAEGRVAVAVPLVPAPQRSYGLRCGEEDMVVSSLDEANELFERYQLAGGSPRGFSLVPITVEGARRDKLIMAQLQQERVRQEGLEAARLVEEEEEKQWRRCRHAVREAYQLQDVERLARLVQRVARLELERDGGEWEGSSSFETVDEEEGDYSGYSMGDVVSEVEAWKRYPKTWRVTRAEEGTCFYRTQDALAYRFSSG
ncbi:hypothetical protein C8J57DRAFT_1219546 [Mycena rebaudengoi]|nr:hypothetical protein C8J57DRAFT_1219546 [Mycena rebaudengoi]